MKVADGTELEPFRVGQRVRHRASGLIGIINAWEWNGPGVLSVVPYTIVWDDDDKARSALGTYRIYATHDMLEALP